jgi:hypothetical protein
MLGCCVIVLISDGACRWPFLSVSNGEVPGEDAELTDEEEKRQR